LQALHPTGACADPLQLFSCGKTTEAALKRYKCLLVLFAAEFTEPKPAQMPKIF
jgi:hypothetical protein